MDMDTILAYQSSVLKLKQNNYNEAAQIYEK